MLDTLTTDSILNFNSCSAGEAAPAPTQTLIPTGPTTAPTKSPTALPTVAGAISTGYIVVTRYSDYYTCSTVSSVTLYRLGACIVSSTTSSYKYLNYNPAFFASTGSVSVDRVAYSDGSCGTVSSIDFNSWSGWSCDYYLTAYSSSLPVLPPGVITA